MGEYKRTDYVTVVDEDGTESEVPKAWLGTELLPEGVKKVDGRRRSQAKDSAAEALEAAEGAAKASAEEAERAKAEVERLTGEVESLKAALEKAQAGPSAANPANAAPASSDTKK